jgi:homoserine dehydrogenase
MVVNTLIVIISWLYSVYIEYLYSWKKFHGGTVMAEIKIGFLGFGNVGTGAYKIIEQNGNDISCREGFSLKVEKILVRNKNKIRTTSVSSDLLTDNIDDIINNAEITVVAEFIGGVEPAKEYIKKALERGKSVVTANKELMAKHWHELENTARQNGAGLYYEASVAGGIPVIKLLRESLQANHVKEVMGIINGTTNFILTKMSEEGRSFKDVLEEAQRLGYAEPDPTADIEGWDAMYKLAILSSLSFHTRVHIEGVREGIKGISVEDISYGKELGYSKNFLLLPRETGILLKPGYILPSFL